jgi:hypothetical protein
MHFTLSSQGLVLHDQLYVPYTDPSDWDIHRFCLRVQRPIDPLVAIIKARK